MKLKRLSVLAMLSFGLLGSAFAGVSAFEKVTTATEEGVAEILKGMEFEPEIADGEVRFDHSGMTISIFVSPSDPEEGEMDSLYMVTMLPFDTEKADEVNLLNAENRFIRLYPNVEDGETPLVAAEWDVMVNPGISKWALEYTIREYLEMAELAADRLMPEERLQLTTGDFTGETLAALLAPVPGVGSADDDWMGEVTQSSMQAFFDRMKIRSFFDDARESLIMTDGDETVDALFFAGESDRAYDSVMFSTAMEMDSVPSEKVEEANRMSRWVRVYETEDGVQFEFDVTVGEGISSAAFERSYKQFIGVVRALKADMKEDVR